MKAYTNLEQSKKLSEILPIESADMCYLSKDGRGIEFFEEPVVIDGTLEIDDIPAWSLAALLGLMPKFSLERDVSNNVGYQLHYNYNTTYYDEPVDAAFEMICWLKENNKI